MKIPTILELRAVRRRQFQKSSYYRGFLVVVPCGDRGVDDEEIKIELMKSLIYWAFLHIREIIMSKWR